ncbi:MAG TPA: hypothetical protein VFZ66_03970 [Herpetosiphonaceae bacterium]
MSNRDINAHGAGRHQSTCDHVRERLPAYVTAEALGQQPQRAYPDVAAHVGGCETCRAELDELREVILATYTGGLEPAPAYPQPDLSFLPSRAVQAARTPPWRFDELGRLIIGFSQALLDSLRPPSLVGAARGQLLYSYALEPRPLPDLAVSVDVLADDAALGFGFVRVNVEALDRGPLDQAPSFVVLRAGGAIWQGLTDEAGYVAFEAVPLTALPDLTIEITPDADA